MLTLNIKKKYYEALLAKDSSFDGVFYVGVKTTGVFCRSICPARKPKFENCEFFETAEDALLASFRPCKKCQPLSHPDKVPEIVTELVDAVENEPEKRWREKDFKQLSTNAAQASRLFKKRFGMTFVQYARARRMGLAFNELKAKKSVIFAQVDVGYDSGSGFRDAFSKILGSPPVKADKIDSFVAKLIDTPLGPMLAVAKEEALYLLEFVNRRGLEREIERLRKKTKAAILFGSNKLLDQVAADLKKYFAGDLLEFDLPLKMLGTPFEKEVWGALKKIPYGKTCSYVDIAKAIEKPKASRAIGRANGVNQIAILIPCHRVINANGDLGGYGGGVAKKKWLLEHERKHQ